MVENTSRTVTVTRQELYEQVWATPISKLCKTYGLSDVGLAKVCKRYDIPRPPLGYWAKREFGKAPPQPPLPERKEQEYQAISFYIEPQRDETESASPSPPVYDDDVARLLERARQLPPIRVSSTLRSLHPLVRNTWDGLRESTWVERGLLRPIGRGRQILNIRVSREQIPRALCFMNTLIRTIEKTGGRISAERQAGVCVFFADECVSSPRLRERYNQRPHVPRKGGQWDFLDTGKKVDFVPNGRFVLEAGCIYQDTDKSKIEERINEIVIDFVRRVGDNRIYRKKEEEDRKRREEDARVQREKVLELQRQRAELQQKQREEQARVDHLIKEAEAWHKSQGIRTFIRAVHDAVIGRDGKIDDGSGADQWLQWASQQADRIDPLVVSPPSVLDERI